MCLTTMTTYSKLLQDLCAEEPRLCLGIEVGGAAYASVRLHVPWKLAFILIALE